MNLSNNCLVRVPGTLGGLSELLFLSLHSNQATPPLSTTLTLSVSMLAARANWSNARRKQPT